MSDIENWLIRYEKSHRNLRNPTAFWTAVPMLLVGISGLLWTLPIPEEFYEISPLLNWGTAFLMVTAIYYFIISLSLAIGLLPFLLGLAAIQLWLADSSYPPFGIAAGLTLAGVAGLALGRGGPFKAIVQDIQMIMIGPAWLLSILFRRFGIPV